MQPQGDRTVSATIAEATQVLAAAGCTDAAHDAKAIIADGLDLQPDEVDSDGTTAIPSEAYDRIHHRIARRSRREPLGYILGRCRFREIELLVDPRVIIPVPETTTLVDIALRLDRGSRVHDVGTGSGAVALAIKQERPDLVVSGSDISPDAIEIARSNAARMGLDVTFTVQAGLPSGEYDLVVANLPYQDDTGQTNADPPEITDHQPPIAIFGGGDGLDHIRTLLQRAPAGLTVALQHAASQAEAVAALLVEPESFGDPTAPHRFTVGRVA